MNLAQPMQIEPISDFGQKIAAPAGKVIGLFRYEGRL